LLAGLGATASCGGVCQLEVRDHLVEVAKDLLWNGTLERAEQRLHCLDREARLLEIARGLVELGEAELRQRRHGRKQGVRDLHLPPRLEQLAGAGLSWAHAQP